MGKYNRSLSKLSLSLVVVLSVWLGTPNFARADLINTKITSDLVEKMEGSVDNTKISFANAVFKAPPRNWSIQIAEGNYDQDPKGTNNDIKVTVRHLVAPHAGEPAPNPNGIVGYLFNVTPGGKMDSWTGGTQHGAHEDTLTLTYEAMAGGGGSTLSFKVIHAAVLNPAPEPGSLLLCLTGVAAIGGMMVGRKRRAAAVNAG